MLSVNSMLKSLWMRVSMLVVDLGPTSKIGDNGDLGNYKSFLFSVFTVCTTSVFKLFILTVMKIWI